MAQRQFKSDDTDKWLYGFGDGSTGSTYAVPSNEGCSGTSGATAVTLAAAGTFANGDLVLIHQTRGTGVGTWELNKIASGGGTTSLTMTHALTNTYTDSGASQAQMIEMNQYDSVTTGAISAPTWDGSKGGIVAFFDKGTATIGGTITLKSFGFIGGDSPLSGSTGYQGEGTPGAGGQSGSANGNGGGAGSDFQNHGGAGGGNGAAASNTTGGIVGGAAVGNAGLTSMNFGGAGGAMGSFGGIPLGKYGGDGAGIAFIFAKNIVITGAINLNGDAGVTKDPAGNNVGGGGGAGGSCLLKCQTATLGTALITASGGAGASGGSANKTGTAGAVGRIHIDYSGSYTGTTTPTIDATLDSTIVSVSAGGAFLLNFI